MSWHLVFRGLDAAIRALAATVAAVLLWILAHDRHMPLSYGLVVGGWALMVIYCAFMRAPGERS